MLYFARNDLVLRQSVCAVCVDRVLVTNGANDITPNLWDRALIIIFVNKPWNLKP